MRFMGIYITFALLTFEPCPKQLLLCFYLLCMIKQSRDRTGNLPTNKVSIT